MNLLEHLNTQIVDKSPREIIALALKQGAKPVLTTNFRPYEVAILHAVTQLLPKIPVLWCDTGYNTPETYQHAEYVINKLSLNIYLYVPKQTVAHRNVIMGIPDISSPLHNEFTQQVKLEPFTRAMANHQPDVWFTNLRKGQTAFRNSIDVFSRGNEGLLKVSPFYHFSDQQLDHYLLEHRLKNEFNYYDPTKVLEHRECGLHITNPQK